MGYLKGTVPYFQVYPGAYIPRELEFVRDDGETSASDLAHELVGLSKLNFNNTQFDSGDYYSAGCSSGGRHFETRSKWKEGKCSVSLLHMTDCRSAAILLS
jgi:hypothetical protein